MRDRIFILGKSESGEAAGKGCKKVQRVVMQCTCWYSCIVRRHFEVLDLEEPPKQDTRSCNHSASRKSVVTTVALHLA